MVAELDRDGVFKAMIVEWGVKKSETSLSVAVSCRFEARAKLESDDKGASFWDDWTQYEPMSFVGDYWIIGKDGKINEGAVQQLVRSTGWDGKLASVLASLPPRPIVQVTVKPDTYKDKTRYKAGWMNPEDYVGGSGNVDAKGVAAMDSQFGSLLRAAAGAAAPKAAAGAKPAAAAAKGRPKAPPRKVDEALAPIGTGEDERGNQDVPEEPGSVPF